MYKFDDIIKLTCVRQIIESRLKVTLPSNMGSALVDGVVLCHLVNHVRPRAVPSIHVPSPAVVSLANRIAQSFFGYNFVTD
jgi:hypothetical protein